MQHATQFWIQSYVLKNVAEKLWACPTLYSADTFGIKTTMQKLLDTDWQRRVQLCQKYSTKTRNIVSKKKYSVKIKKKYSVILK